MKRSALVAVPVVLTALVMNLTIPVVGDSQNKKSAGARGGQTPGQGKVKSASGNAQWSADPERGWVRADELGNAQERTRASKTSKINNKKLEAEIKREKR